MQDCPEVKYSASVIGYGEKCRLQRENYSTDIMILCDYINIYDKLQFLAPR